MSGAKVGFFVLMLAMVVWAASAARPAKPLALVFSTQLMPHEALLRQEGWEVRHVAMPCDNSLPCWANRPGRVAGFRTQIDTMLRGRKDVLLFGVSRGGYMALSMADLPQVSRVVALAPMTQPGKPAVWSGPYAMPLDPARIAGKPVFLQVGNTDDTVDTQATIRYASVAMNPQLTLVVDATQGHDISDPRTVMAWIKGIKP